jgi:hypothetical protein
MATVQNRYKKIFIAKPDRLPTNPELMQILKKLEERQKTDGIGLASRG